MATNTHGPDTEGARKLRSSCITKCTQQKADEVVKKWSVFPDAAAKLLRILISFDAEMADAASHGIEGKAASTPRKI
jgi:hypothetical protein